MQFGSCVALFWMTEGVLKRLRVDLLWSLVDLPSSARINLQNLFQMFSPGFSPIEADENCRLLNVLLN